MNEIIQFLFVATAVYIFIDVASGRAIRKMKNRRK